MIIKTKEKRKMNLKERKNKSLESTRFHKQMKCKKLDRMQNILIDTKHINPLN